ncbi:MAG: hypothetical protein A2521_12805 [Deltaproteobacteria bacterium RIFOXYD12_FULL_57_12]|nr:MAG: hypothetical protein A2521_12805 [Deltaproteobacteria bacterium RIFOXYD12_FULL_57_12]
MNYRIQDLIDIPKLQGLLDSLSLVSGIPFAIIDLEGTIFTRSGWQDICTKFHRVNPETQRDCIESNKNIVSGASISSGQAQITCPRGLIVIATPLIIDGNHLANIFSGQIFLVEPDWEFFRQQARTFGFDEQDYLAALAKVPVITQKKLDQYLSFVADLAKSLAFQGLNELRNRETHLALRESGIKLQAMLDNIPDLVWLKDQESRFLAVNEAFGQACGRRPVDLVGKTDLDVWPRELAERYRQDDFDVMALGRRKQVEEPLSEKDGQTRWIETIKTPIRDQAGAIVGTTGIARDITERKQAEATIRKEREQARQYLDTAGVMLVALDTQGRITLINKKGCAILGYDEQELLGRNWFDVGLSKTRFEEVMGVFRKLMQGEFALVEYYENPVLTKAGDERQIAFYNTLLYDQQGSIVGVLFSGEDVTERRRAEEELRLQSAILNNMTEGVYLIRMDGIIVYANLKFKEMFGYDSEELIGRHASMVNYPTEKDPEETAREILDILDKEGVWQGEIQNIRKDGTPFWSYASVSVFSHSQHGKVLVAVHSDITERKQAEEERIKLERRLEQARKAESLGRMAGAIAHLFNNQLAVVIGNLELVLDDLPQESDFRPSLIASMQASRKAAETSRLMLAYLGQTTGLKKPLDLGEAIREALPLFHASMSVDVSLKTEIPPQGPFILGDSAYIKQILGNLITNASEAIGEGKGEIAVSLRTVSKAETQGLRFIPLHWEPKAENYVCLSVSDTGCGMDETTLEKIFDPFFSTKFVGRGLGLPVVLGLVRAHDGAITVENQLDHGATIQVFFPLHTQTLPSLKEDQSVSSVLEKGGLALVVDDEPMVRDMAQAMLKRKFGYQVLAARDGYEAVEIFRVRKDEISLVLLDLSMPGMNGWETLARLRALRPDIRVIIASGYDEAQVMQGDYPERPQAVIRKPYSLADLKAVLEKVQKGGIGSASAP